MRHLIHKLTMCGIAMVIAATAVAQSVELRLRDGSRWRGQVADQVQMTILEAGVERTLEGRLVQAADLYLVLETTILGKLEKKTIFRSDIISMKTLSGAPAASDAETTGVAGNGSAPAAGSGEATSTGKPLKSDQPGVFFLPLEGMVGIGIRHDEIEAIGKEADKYGPGQIIVLEIDTNGGLVLEAEEIDETIQDLQKRHRVVAWVRKAISAGCSLAMACQEIYFMTEGTAGSVTTLAGNRSLPEDQVQSHIDALVETCKRNGHSEHIARAMKLNKHMCSYDKDPVTGEVTFYGDLRGQYILSDANSNLTFNSSNALHCGFSDGTADTPEELATLLDLPKWHELTDYGRKISEQWQNTAERAQADVRRLFAQYEYKNVSTGDPIVILGTRIQIMKQLISWWRRAPNVCFMSGVPPVEALEREVASLQKQIADIRRAQRGG